MAYSWDYIRSQVRQFRSNLHSIYPIQVWTMTKDFRIHNRVLFYLSNNRDPNTITPTAQLQLYKIDLMQRMSHTIRWPCSHLSFIVDHLNQDSPSERDYLHSLWATCSVLKSKMAIPGLELYGENDCLHRSSITCIDIVHNTMLFTWREEHYVIPDITQKVFRSLI